MSGSRNEPEWNFSDDPTPSRRRRPRAVIAFVVRTTPKIVHVAASPGRRGCQPFRTRPALLTSRLPAQPRHVDHLQEPDVADQYCHTVEVHNCFGRFRTLDYRARCRRKRLQGDAGLPAHRPAILAWNIDEPSAAIAPISSPSRIWTVSSGPQPRAGDGDLARCGFLDESPRHLTLTRRYRDGAATRRPDELSAAG